MTVTSELITRVEGRAGIVSLNRPAALHALTFEMVRGLDAQLRAWARDPAIECVLLDHASGRGFCSGGDIRWLQESLASDGGQLARRFFFEEYQLNQRIFSYPKPYVAFVHGIVMGGGVGISLPARYRVATEATRFAMPETGIGLFPDVGGSWYLSRLPGRIGRYLALTGARISGAECLALGLATHYLPSASLETAKQRIAAQPERIPEILAALSVSPPAAPLLEQRERIDRLFASDVYEDVLRALGEDDSPWAAQTLATLRAKAPLANKVALRQLATGATLRDFADVMRMEYRLASRMIGRPDFSEGVRAVIVDKDNAPRWQPAAEDSVTSDMLDSMFAPLPAADEWCVAP